MCFKTEFPTKTFLTPSTNESLVNRRKIELNSTHSYKLEFIHEVVTGNDNEIFIDFLEFLDVKQAYTKERILLPYQKESDKKMDEDVILDLLVKLGAGQEGVIGFLNDLDR
jgi:hypothetical protein